MDQTIGDAAAREKVASKMGRLRSLDPEAAGRRHSFRVRVPGRVSLWHKHEFRGQYELQNLCIEGCSLIGRADCNVGERVALALHLQNRPTLWLTADVRRSSPHNIALRFVDAPPRVEDHIQDVVVEAYARTHDHGDSFSLVIEPRIAIRSALVRKLDELGERAVGIATPLDAVQLLLERSERVLTAFIGPQRPLSPGFELAEFLARNYPHVRRVLIGAPSELSDAWVAETTGEADALLELPCSEDALRKLVHRISMLPRELC